jgi:hypothetical protein
MEKRPSFLGGRLGKLRTHLAGDELAAEPLRAQYLCLELHAGRGARPSATSTSTAHEYCSLDPWEFTGDPCNEAPTVIAKFSANN